MGSKEWINELQTLVNKPIYASDGRKIGIIYSVQSGKLVVTSGTITPDKYLIPQSSIKSFDNGIVHLSDDSDYIDHNYKFE